MHLFAFELELLESMPIKNNYYSGKLLVLFSIAE